jgi:hypothetical protein
MQDIVKVRFLLFILGLIIVPIATVLVVLFAKGYRPDLKKGEITVTGLLVANSYPEGAQVFINDKLSSATNTTINLNPGDYTVEIKKEGYHLWVKQLKIQPEIVTRATAVLFPSVPTLKPITSAGAAHPVLSPDGTKAAFLSPDNMQLYTLDLTESPLGLLNREAKLLADFKNLKFKIENLIWSPDSRQILAYSPGPDLTASSAAYLVDTSNQQTTNTSANITPIIDNWNLTQHTQELQKLSTLPVILQNILATSAANLVWSPQENKLLYTATASAVIPDQLIKPLAGSDTQPQERLLTPGHVYVYDLEEDRNFKIDEISLNPAPTALPKRNTKKLPVSAPASPSLSLDFIISHKSGWNWFPTSAHLYKIDTDKITLVEYDGTNKTVVYEGPLVDKSAIPYPSAKQMLILADLSTTPAPGSTSAEPNLYALTLR